MLKQFSFQKDQFRMNEKIILKHVSGFSFLGAGDIVRIEADNNYVKLFLVDGEMIHLAKTLKQMEATLPENAFIRVHRSHLINPDFVKSYRNIKGSFAVLQDGTRVPVSRRKLAGFVEALQKKGKLP
ncbi:MAG: LytTR family DNA-binding domain-containing protein [Bacteroidota bacterium]